MPIPDFEPEYLEFLEMHYQLFRSDPTFGRYCRILEASHTTKFRDFCCALIWLNDLLRGEGPSAVLHLEYAHAEMGRRANETDDLWEVAKECLARWTGERDHADLN